MDLLKELRSYGGLKLRGGFARKIFIVPSGETIHRTRKSFAGAKTCMLEVLYHLAKFGGARISPAARAAENVEFFLSHHMRYSMGDT